MCHNPSYGLMSSSFRAWNVTDPQCTFGFEYVAEVITVVAIMDVFL